MLRGLWGRTKGQPWLRLPVFLVQSCGARVEAIRLLSTPAASSWSANVILRPTELPSACSATPCFTSQPKPLELRGCGCAMYVLVYTLQKMHRNSWTTLGLPAVKQPYVSLLFHLLGGWGGWLFRPIMPAPASSTCPI